MESKSWCQENYEVDKYTFILLLSSLYSLASPFCYLPFLLPPIASSLVLSVLSVDSGNLKPTQDQELVIHCANSHKSIYILIAFQE